MLKGNIIDVYPDNKENVMVTWIKDKNRTCKIKDKFYPSFFVQSNTNSLYKLAAQLQDLPEIKYLNITKAKTILGQDKKKIVLEIKPHRINFLNKIADFIDLWGRYQQYKLFNVDIRIATRYLQEKGVFCNAMVKCYSAQ